MINRTKNNKPARLSLRWIKFFLKGIAISLLLIIISLSILLAYPKILSPFIIDYFERRGVVVSIDKLSANWNNGYQLNGLFDANSILFPISVKQVDFTTTIDVFKLVSKDFVEKLEVKGAKITVPYDVQQITNTFKQLKSYLKSNKDKTFNKDLYRILPNQWKLSAEIFPEQIKNIDKDIFLVNVSGKKKQLDQLLIEHKTSGKIKVIYEASNNTYDISSDSLDLTYFFGKAINLKRIRATIFSKNMLYSTGFAEVMYEGVEGDISLIGKGSELKVDIRSGGKRIGLSVEKFDKESYVLDFERFDLAFVQILTPILDETLKTLDSNEFIDYINHVKLSGYLSGQLKLDKNSQIKTALFNTDSLKLNYDGNEITGITGRLDWNEGLFHYTLALEKSVIVLPKVFKTPISVDKGWLAGTIDLPNKKLKLSELSITNNHIEKLLTTGTWSWKNKEIDLSIKGDNIDISKLDVYLNNLVSNNLSNYFNSAFVQGKKNKVKVLIKGQYPELITSKNSVFLVDFSLQNSLINFYKNKSPPAWIKQATVKLNKHHLSINIDKGYLIKTIKARDKGIGLKGVAEIKNLKAPILNVDIQLDKKSSHTVFSIAKKSIAKAHIKNIESTINLDKVDIEGKLALNIDLKKERQTTFDVELNLSKGKQISLKKLPELKVKQFTSQIIINEKGLASLHLKGNYDKKPVSLNLKKKRGDYRFDAKLTSSVLSLLSKISVLNTKAVNFLNKQRLIEGQSHFFIDGLLSENMRLKKLLVESDLADSRLNFWNVITKEKSQTLPLIIKYSDEKSKKITIKLGDKNHLISVLNKKGNVVKTHLIIGKKKSSSSSKQPFHLTLISPKAQVNNFLNFTKQWQSLSENNTPFNNKFSINVDIIKAEIGQVTNEVRNNKFPLKIKGNLDYLSIKSPLITGLVTYQPNQFTADLNHLDLYRLFHLFKKEELNVAGRKVNRLNLAKRLPVMNVKSQSVIWKDNSIGKLDLVTNLNNNLYGLDHLFLEGNHFYIQASGGEIVEKKGVTTRLAIDIKSENIRDVVRSFQLNDIVDGKFMDLSINLSWLGRAHLLNIDKSKGEVILQAQNLKFINIGTGVGSVLGLVDLVGTLNRILLNFKNVNTSKLAFDNMNGKWKIDNGIAFAENVSATGSLIDLEIKGTVNLFSRKFNNLKIEITPKASNVIPIVGAVGAGPLGAAVGFVVQKIVGGQLNKVAKYTYYVTGDWSNPQLNKF